MWYLLGSLRWKICSTIFCAHELFLDWNGSAVPVQISMIWNPRPSSSSLEENSSLSSNGRLSAWLRRPPYLFVEVWKCQNMYATNLFRLNTTPRNSLPCFALQHLRTQPFSLFWRRGAPRRWGIWRSRPCWAEKSRRHWPPYPTIRWPLPTCFQE